MDKKINEVGHKIDDGIEQISEKHGFTKFQTWLYVALAAIGAVTVILWFC